MAKRDFILKQDSNQSFIERENRTTVMGIIAIVAIVLVVATFMKVTHIVPFSGLANNNIQGLVVDADSFFGEHSVQLQAHEAIFAQFNVQGIGERSLYAYIDEGVLVVDFGTHFVRVLLQKEQDNLYTARYPETVGNREVDIAVNTVSKQYSLSGVTDSAFPLLPATSFIAYDGTLVVAGKEYLFQLFEDDLAVTVDGEPFAVALEQNGEVYSGVWITQEGQHDITFSPRSRELTITNLY